MEKAMKSRFAASRRKPSTPRESKSLAYWASRLLTYSVSVARLEHLRFNE